MAWRIPVATLFARFFHGALELHVVQIDLKTPSQLSSIVELRFFNHPVPFSNLLSTYLTKHLTIHHRAWMLPELLFSRPWTTCNQAFCSLLWVKTCPWPRHFLAPINDPIFVNATFQQHIICPIRPPDNINVFESFFGMTLLSERRLQLLVARDNDKCDSQKYSRNRVGLQCRPPPSDSP